MTDAEFSNLETMTIFKPEKLRQRVRKDPAFNLIVAGASRGGTSSPGLLMRALGFDAGKQVNPVTHEDQEFASLVEMGREVEIPDLIKRRNTENPSWSLKLPWALSGCHVFDEHCANPVFFIIIRNPMSVALSLSAHDPQFEGKPMSGFRHVYEFYHYGMNRLENISAPYVICEYEKTLEKPQRYVEEFAATFGVRLSASQIANATELISAPGYRELNEPEPRLTIWEKLASKLHLTSSY